MLDNLREGQGISYVGDGGNGRSLGDRGRILAEGGGGAHVKWADGMITLEDQRDIAPLAVAAVSRGPVDDLADSLEVGPVRATGLRQALNEGGSGGAVRVLASSGQLGDLDSIVEETLAFVAVRIRTEPVFLAAVSSLEEDEADELASVAARQLLSRMAGHHG